jgi:cyclic dehypoxanthinyl futalosine synthase
VSLLKPHARSAKAQTGIVTADGRLVAAGVPYLNARPLVDPLEDAPFSSRFSLVRAPSFEVARMLAEEECGVALMPVAAAATLGGIEIVRGAAVTAKGRVRSVLLCADRPLDELDTIVLDSTSRTSVVLGRLIVAARRNAAVRYESARPEDAVGRVGGRTGAVVIADLALRQEGRFAHTIDLGEAWLELTGLPFVFAAWSARAGILRPGDADALRAALEVGLEKRADYAADHAKKTGDDGVRARAYLDESIRYRLGDDEAKGLQEFFDRASKAGLLPETEGRCAGETAKAPRRPASIDGLLARAHDGERLSGDDAERIYREAPLFELGLAADAVRKRKHPDGVVTYIVDRNVNYTNVCTTSCRFCAFYRPVGHPEAYVLSREVLGQKLQEVVDAGGVQILLQGGLNPELPLTWYEDLFRWMKTTYKLGLHALSPEEILHLSRLESLSTREVLERLHAAGLDSVPGGGAEILTDRVRSKIAKAKCTSDEWLSVMRVAHQMGLRSSGTMMYGTTDDERDRVLHLLKLRDLQDETGGFTAFFCWDYQYEQGVKQKAGETGTSYYLRTQALSRLVLDNFDHVGASWVTQGPDVGEIALRFGADDFGSVMFEENVVSSAGTTFCIDASAIEGRIHAAGFKAVRRNVRYDWLGTPALRS